MDYGPPLLRLVLGPLFVIPGVQKLIGMLGGGHPVVGMLWESAALAWLLLLVEILFGLAVFVGWKVQYTVWPLAIVMLGAIFVAVVPSFSITSLLFHMLAIAALGSLAVTGPGALAAD